MNRADRMCWLRALPQTDALDLAAIIRPMQQRLPLAFSAPDVAGLTVHLNLANMAPHGFPAFDLPCILAGEPAAHVVAAIPLEPAAWIVRMYPALLAPNRKRLAGVDAEVVQASVRPVGR